MSSPGLVVFVVDDDRSVRDALADLVRTAARLGTTPSGSSPTPPK
jgi:FixJ family two-component response regulator